MCKSHSYRVSKHENTNTNQSPSVLSSPEDTKLYFCRVIKPMDLGLVDHQNSFQVRRTSGSLRQGETALLTWKLHCCGVPRRWQCLLKFCHYSPWTAAIHAWAAPNDSSIWKEHYWRKKKRYWEIIMLICLVFCCHFEEPVSEPSRKCCTLKQN